MIEYLLRAEGVNMDNFIFDTHDISTIRGGSFLLNEAFSPHQENSKKYWEKLGLTPISLEANTGLFLFELKEKKDPEEIRKKVLKRLEQNCQNQVTFVVDYTPRTGNFRKELQILLAKNHRRQYHELSVKLPESRDTKNHCELDGVRPGIHYWTPNATESDKKLISEFAKFRKRIGIDYRKNLSENLLLKRGLDFTNDLEELAKDSTKGNLDGKIAFIYIDGNRFGKIRNSTCENIEKLERFQEKVQSEIRENALTRILTDAVNRASFKTQEERIRLELLMWGGDEIEFVVPAWQGWNALKLFFADSQSHEYEGLKLTHSVGLVFCHANAPILHIRKLAKDLCDRAKENIGEVIKVSDNRISFMVLDSIDQLYQKKYDPRLIIESSELDNIEKNMLQMKQYFPHNKVFVIEDLVERKEPVKDELDSIISIIPKEKQDQINTAISSIINLDQHHDYKNWTIISNLWDFINQEENQ